MTNSSPPEPPQSPPPRRPILSLDELIGIIVAFGTIGAILFWTLGNRIGLVFVPVPRSVTDAQTPQEDISGVEPRRSSRLETPEAQPIIPPPVEQPEQPVEPEPPAALIAPRRSTGFNRLPVFVPIPGVTPQQEAQPPVVSPPTEPPETAEAIPPETPPEEAEQEATAPLFSDVPNDYWAYPFIVPLAQQKLLLGLSDNRFQPDEPVTRAQLAAQIEEAFRQQPSRDLINFEDISQGTETANKIDEAVKTGFLAGYPGQVFRPDQQVPRLQVLVALASGLGLEASQDPDQVLSNYQDADRIPDWAREKIAAATEAGLVVNRPNFTKNSLNPDGPATRAEVAAMIHQGLVQAGRLDKISSEYIINTP